MKALAGLIAGLLIAVAAAAGGFQAFLLAIVLGGAGLAAGSYLDGRSDIGQVFGERRR
ncbi:MAG: hypothetical protein ACRCTR_02645 [Actinomycetota bacterium]